MSERNVLGADDALQPPPELLVPLKRTVETDKQWTSHVSGVDFRNHIFQRVSAKNLRFENVDFRYCTFDGCYIRRCAFDSCDFTGSKFVGSSFHGSTFEDCAFDYALFEKTLIDSDVLDTCSPRRENMKQWFARTLRTNYQSLGDSDAVNKAILVELHATRTHLRKAWRSKEPYYRKKYTGVGRITAFFRWMRFVLSDVIWGNGESAPNLIRTAVVLVVVLASFDTLLTRNPMLVADWAAALVDAPQVFLGITLPAYPGLIVVLIALARYVVLGLFVSILVRRYARR